jgi:hypothetical protein
MAVNITNITELISPEKAGPPSTWSNMGDTTQNNCHNFKLSGVSTCGDLTDAELFLEIPAFDPIIYNKITRSIEYAPGKDLETYKSKDPRIVFTIYGDADLQQLLEIIESHQTITFTNIAGGQDEEVQSMQIEIQPEGSLLQIKITLGFKDAETVTQLCCGSYYEEAPFIACDGEGETGEPNNDNACTDYEAAIAFTDSPATLTASTTGGGDGVETFKWYKDGVYFGDGVAINPVLSGVYRVDAKKGNCSDSESFTYSLPCEGFEVTILTIVLPDGTVMYIAGANLLADYQWQELIADVWTDIEGETSITYQPSASGTFRVVATAGECEDDSEEVEYEAPTTCTDLYTLTLVNDGGTLVLEIVDYEGAGTPSIQWWMDSGSGLTLTAFTGLTVPDAAPGYYTAIVNIDECLQAISLLVVCTPVDSDCPECGEVWFQEWVAAGGETELTLTNFSLIDPAFATTDEIEATHMITRDQAVCDYEATPTLIREYSIDYASQTITFPAAFPLEAGTKITARKFKRTS